ncbi:MAG TPA: TadE/TadG family type IV pilus assembly protein [Pseudolabrys sp.]|nr:TadE/TadG family type IV pilus assembly protein [Pseudolabrys sp.]
MVQAIMTILQRIECTLQRIECTAQRHARRFARQQDGAAAVEFALVATPFIAMMFAIIQTALVFFSGQALETAAANSARLILTGQAQTAGMTQASFKTQVCNNLTALFDCTNSLYVDVETYSSFASINTAPPVSNGALNTSGFAYNPGSAGSIVVVRLYYQWPIYVRMLGLAALANLSATNSNLLVATAAFRNEPYQ